MRSGRIGRDSRTTCLGVRILNAIFIHDLRVETKIGVYEWERHMPQTIRIDLEFGLPSARPFTSGEFADAIDYAAVVARIKALAANNPHPLVERFAESVAQLVLVEFGAPSVKVRVAKLAPLPGVRELGVMIERENTTSV
ncbi:MAG TPA: dihydroneopterin aldolase [Casimicrobiaceae bacterium]